MGISLKDALGFAAPIVGAVGNILGGKSEAKAAKEAAEMNAAAQREFAQMGVRWKVADAKAAGIHPLVALGAQTTSFTPSYVGDSSAANTYRELGNMGQDISRSVSKSSTQEERDIATLQIQSAKLDVEGKALDNQIRAQRLRQLQAGPAMPSVSGSSFIPGQANSGSGIIDKPLERTKTLKGSAWSEPGALPDTGWVTTPNGGLVPVPSKDIKERIEDNVFQEGAHFLRNNVMPNFGSGPKPPKSSLPKGYKAWVWDHLNQEYRPSKTGRGRFHTMPGRWE